MPRKLSSSSKKAACSPLKKTSSSKRVKIDSENSDIEFEEELISKTGIHRILL